jgi:hypothetical protein
LRSLVCWPGGKTEWVEDLIAHTYVSPERTRDGRTLYHHFDRAFTVYEMDENFKPQDISYLIYVYFKTEDRTEWAAKCSEEFETAKWKAISYGLKNWDKAQEEGE